MSATFCRYQRPHLFNTLGCYNIFRLQDGLHTNFIQIPDTWWSKLIFRENFAEFFQKIVLHYVCWKKSRAQRLLPLESLWVCFHEACKPIFASHFIFSPWWWNILDVKLYRTSISQFSNLFWQKPEVNRRTS